jgi:hypothetical protein
VRNEDIASKILFFIVGRKRIWMTKVDSLTWIANYGGGVVWCG